MKDLYIRLVLVILGIFALITAVLIAWPVIAHFAS